MPHLIVEYAKELESEIVPATLLNTVYQASLDSGLFEAEDIKVRMMAFEQHCIGGKPGKFVHVTSKILSGRNVEQRSSLAKGILTSLDRLFSANVSLTVEVCDIERESYAKVVK